MNTMLDGDERSRGYNARVLLFVSDREQNRTEQWPGERSGEF